MAKIPIIILHGWNLESKKFSVLTRLLEKNKFRVYCPDLPGFGKSPKPEKPLNLDSYVDFVLRFMEKKKIAEAYFICHSFGGRIGIKLAAFYPEKVNKIILTGTPGLIPVPRLKVLLYLYLAKIGKLIFSIPLLSGLENLAQKIIYKMANASDYYHTDQSLRVTFQNVVAEKLETYLPRIKSPTLLLWGDNDTFVPIGIARRMEILIPNCRLLSFPKVGHGLPYSHPELFIKNLFPFIK